MGYFPVADTDPGVNLPGGIIFTCLSHDIIAIGDQKAADAGKNDNPPDFIFRGGCTLLIDVENVTSGAENCVRYCVGKGIESERRLEAQRRYFTEPTSPSLWATYFGDLRPAYGSDGDADAAVEPFALLSRAYAYEEEV